MTAVSWTCLKPTESHFDVYKAAASLPEAMQILAVQKLFYNLNPHPAVGIFLVISTQMLGYGVAGLLRSTLVYPSAMLYPQNIPVASLMESLHKDRKVVQKKLRVFYICFGALFVWQVMPQYISKSLSQFDTLALVNSRQCLYLAVSRYSVLPTGTAFLSPTSLAVQWPTKDWEHSLSVLTGP